METISLGSLSVENFLCNYWQKKPLLVRNALPNFQGLLSYDELMALACQEDVQSRLITQKKNKWIVKHGPLLKRDYTNLQKSQWTVLVQDVNHYLDSARDLLAKFSFIPHARLDDLMISYAPKGGGIGPHYDSYDVFLLQGLGSRRWQISTPQQDPALIEGAPLKILRNFNPEQEWILESGDMLYLPPNYAHNGVAEENCMTYSIGFRAPSHQELITQFLIYLQDNIEIDGWYNDPDLMPQQHPAKISQTMYRQVHTILNKIKWQPVDIRNFLGIYLTEPKNHVFFSQPTSPLTQNSFVQRIKKNGLKLDLKSRMLAGEDNTLFLNGETYSIGSGAYQSLLKLANYQALLPCDTLNNKTAKILYQWYLNGYILVK